jgi:transposase InsO family protein
MPAAVEARVCELRRHKPFWGPVRIAHQLAREGVDPVPSHMGIWRALARHHLIEPKDQRKKLRTFKRWERARPMELWQLDVVGGVLLADGTECKVLTGIDDHSRFCVAAGIMTRAVARAVCGVFAQSLRTHGVPDEVLTDNGKVFTGRFATRPAEVLFDRICRENGINHILTAPRSPTTTGKIERSTEACASSSSPGGSSMISALLRPSSTPGSTTTTPTGPIGASAWPRRRSGSPWAELVPLPTSMST